MAIVIVATIRPLAEHYQAVRAALLRAIPLVHEEPGCELYALHVSDDSFVMIEQWHDEAAVTAHGVSPAFGTLVAALDGKLASSLDLQTMRPIPAGTGEQGQLV